MRRVPLRLRLTLAFALAMGLVLAATGFFLHAQLRGTLDEQIDQSLRARADDVAALLHTDSADLSRDRGRLAETEESFAQVLEPDGTVRDATLPLGHPSLLTPEQLTRARRGTFFVERAAVPGLDEARARLLAAPIAVERGTLVVVAGASLDDRDEALGGLRAQLLLGGPIALLAAALLGYGLATAALRPVEAMRRRAEEISAATSGRRLPVPNASDEISRLAGTLNDMLARLDAGLARERRFVAEASHELRTPLALLKTELELALRRQRSPEELRQAVASAAEETDRLARLADNLLILASSDGETPSIGREAVSVAELFEAVARRFARRAEKAGRDIEVESPGDVTLPGDRLRLEQVIGNLVDNALRHGDGPVRLAARRSEGQVELHVTDHGVGFPADFLPVAFERFSRADQSRSEAGAGLGLAITKAVARAHGGTAHAARRSEGGADVWLALPADASAVRSASARGTSVSTCEREATSGPTRKRPHAGWRTP